MGPEAPPGRRWSYIFTHHWVLRCGKTDCCENNSADFPEIPWGRASWPCRWSTGGARRPTPTGRWLGAGFMRRRVRPKDAWRLL